MKYYEVKAQVERLKFYNSVRIKKAKYGDNLRLKTKNKKPTTKKERKAKIREKLCVDLLAFATFE